MRKLIYLSSPHSDPDPVVREIRYQYAMKAIAILMYTDPTIIPFSPIVHTHVLAGIHEMPKGFNFYRDLDLAWIDKCDEVWVLCIEGWKESIGVTAECKYASELGKVIKCFMFDPNDKDKLLFVGLFAKYIGIEGIRL